MPGTGIKLNSKIKHGLYSDVHCFYFLFTECIFLVAKFEFGGSFGLNLEKDCHEVEIILNLKLFVTFGMNLEGVLSRALFIISLQAHFEVTKNSLKKAIS
jgi:hypothetical protein